MLQSSSPILKSGFINNDLLKSVDTMDILAYKQHKINFFSIIILIPTHPKSFRHHLCQNKNVTYITLETALQECKSKVKVSLLSGHGLQYLIHLQEGKMLDAMESKLMCLLTNGRTPVMRALSKVSNSQTKHNFLQEDEQSR